MKKINYTCIFLALCYNSDTSHSSNKINFVKGHFNPSSQNNIEKVDNNKFIAMGMSLIVPGTGQIYQGNLKRGLAYLGVEFLLWNYKRDYDNKGDYYVDLYKEFANENWSFKNWVKHYYSFINDEDPVYETMINAETCILNTTYENSNGNWVQLGDDIEGEAEGDSFGHSVSINSSGNRIAIGGWANDGTASNAGHVRVYEYFVGS